MIMDPNVERLEAQLKNWDAKFNWFDLKDKALMAEAQPQIEYHKRINVIKAKRAAVQSKFEEVRSTGGEKGDSLKVGLETAWKDLDTTFQKLMK